MIEVVAGVMVKDGRMLLQQRPANKDLSFTWETPGGKVEGSHESHHDALRRELREELGIEVGAVSEGSIWCGQVEFEHKPPIFLLFYYVHDWKGEFKTLEGQGLGWFLPEEICMLKLTPGNALALPSLLNVLEKWSWLKSVGRLEWAQPPRFASTPLVRTEDSPIVRGEDQLH